MTSMRILPSDSDSAPAYERARRLVAQYAQGDPDLEWDLLEELGLTND